MTPEGEAFNPGNYYYVGGNSKLYGAVLIRYRAEDFRPIRHLGGTTPGWPISYDELEPWYQRGRGALRRPWRRRAGPDRAAALGTLSVSAGAGRAGHRRRAGAAAARRA